MTSTNADTFVRNNKRNGHIILFIKKVKSVFILFRQSVLVGCDSSKRYLKPEPYSWTKHLRFDQAWSYRKENYKQFSTADYLEQR